MHSSLFNNQRRQRISNELDSGKLKDFNNGNLFTIKSIKGGEPYSKINLIYIKLLLNRHNFGTLESYEQIKEEQEYDDEEQTKGNFLK